MIPRRFLTSRQLRFSCLLEVCVLGSLHCSGVSHRGAKGRASQRRRRWRRGVGPDAGCRFVTVPLCHGAALSQFACLEYDYATRLRLLLSRDTSGG